jgi:uroporphyrinogen decarboxylase
MDSRERTFLALEHKPGDRIPIDFWVSSPMRKKLLDGLSEAYDEFLDHHDVDLRYIAGPDYIGPGMDADRDIWGVTRRTITVPVQHGAESYSEVARSPLADARSVEDIESYPHWPSVDWFDYSVIQAQCDRIRDSGRVAVFMGDRLNRAAQLKPAMYLRGDTEIFMDLAMGEDIASAIFGKIRAFYTVYLERILEAANGKIDIVLTGDDFGAQNGPLIAPDMWRRFIQPGFAEYISIIKAHGVTAMHHTCGSVRDIVPDLIECGLDVLQSVQPEAAGMELGHLKEKFGERLCFHGGLSIQNTIPFGTPEDIRNEVSRIADLFRDSGGYIFCTSHNIQADTSIENVEALMAAYHEFGRRKG